jgi:hypothetical protein
MNLEFERSRDYVDKSLESCLRSKVSISSHLLASTFCCIKDVIFEAADQLNTNLLFLS